MTRRLRGGRRGLTKKVTSINFYLDQVPQIQAIMEATGETKEAPLVRLLVDEALAIRRRKLVQQGTAEQPSPTSDSSQTFDPVQTLLLRMIGLGEAIFRLQGVDIELLQENLVEARAGSLRLWESLAVPFLREKGRSDEDIARLFDAGIAKARDFAYGVAEDIKKELDAADADSDLATEEEDRQGKLAYDAADTDEPNRVERKD